MRIKKIMKLRPFFDLDNLFIDDPDSERGTMDPKHPGYYPGLEVVEKERLPVSEAMDKYGRDALIGPDVLYYSRGYTHREKDPLIVILEKTGRNSCQVVYGDDVLRLD